MNTNKKTITVFTTVHPCYDNRIFLKQIHSLLKKYNIYYFCNKEINVDFKQGDLNKNLEIKYLKKTKNIFKRFLKAYYIIPALLKTKANLYIFHDFELILTGLILKIAGKKVIFDMHEDFAAKVSYSSWIPFFLKPLVRVTCKIMLRTAEVYCDHILLAEDGYKKLLKKNNKHSVIHNYPIVNNKVRYNNKLPCSLVYLGSITKSRGLFRMLELTKLLAKEKHKITLHLIGNFSDENLKNEYDKYVETNSLNNYIKYYGIIPNNKVYNIMSKFTAGLILLDKNDNYKSSISTKMYEYMLFRLPLIVSNIDGWTEIIEIQSKSGFSVDPDNIKDIKEKCQIIFGNEELQKIMGDNGYNLVMAKYSWEKEEIKFFDIIDKYIKK